ncbi:hypothetical protein RHODO2019_18730 (plasmid) [Rhodococcus antarcticus]|jgi:hypothetical protein|uniref:Uncharacterized protein n=1 Tax=Rhodococcus antarcticus TaxID=2987751 RepID=A0ABY6P6X2_9NOCA|nr:hypothetical protein [Rhodococcus antarcticus]UZJ27026.1 hypothetical protein RHODO2019_18730 [Rhodococcus antarcticus]
MPTPTNDPPPPSRVETLLELEHELDVANDSHPARPNTWAVREATPDPARPSRS